MAHIDYLIQIGDDSSVVVTPDKGSGFVLRENDTVTFRSNKPDTVIVYVETSPFDNPGPGTQLAIGPDKKGPFKIVGPKVASQTTVFHDFACGRLVNGAFVPWAGGNSTPVGN
jgi:hypothetical protein